MRRAFASPEVWWWFCGVVGGTAIVTPVAIAVSRKLGFVDKPAPHKFHVRPTPYLGGLAVAISMLVFLVAEFVISPTARIQFIAIALGGTAVAIVGLVDDVRILGPWPRLATQAAAGFGLWASGVRIGPHGLPLLDLLLTLFAVLAVVNAVNLLDNMDGLCAGTVLIAALFAFAAASWQGQRLVGLMALVLAGACLGFLPYNFTRARIFLGDAGTYFIGFLLAAVLMKLDLHGYPALTKVVVLPLLVAVPLFDTALVSVSRWRGRRPLFLGSTDHSSHRLVRLGLSPRLATLVTYGVGAVSGAIALLLLRVNDQAVTWWVANAVLTAAVSLLWQLERVEVAFPSPLEPSWQDELPSVVTVSPTSFETLLATIPDDSPIIR